MTPRAMSWLAAGALLTTFACATLVASEYAHASRTKAVSKLTASVGFVVAALPSAAHTPEGRAILFALAASVVGDALLLARGGIAFRAGVIAFLVAHVGYAAAFVVRGVSTPAVLIALTVLALPALTIGRALVARAPAPLRGAVTAYLVVISAMVALACGTAFARPDVRLPLAAVAFYASDLSVARDRFVAPGFVNRAWGLPLYYAAQLVFAWYASSL